MATTVQGADAPPRRLPWSETAARLERPGGNVIDVQVEHDRSHVAHEDVVVARVHVLAHVGGKLDDRWGVPKEPAEAYREVERIVAYLTEPESDVWVEPNLGLQNHRDRRWHRRSDVPPR